MKQIIVNVSGLSLEEKQRVNEALAKITGAKQLPLFNSRAGWLFAPATTGEMMVTWSFPSETKTPTHTPQQVLEMAGMATNRKVRKDFDPEQSICVDVSSCTDEEKKEVQQAFFDVGIKWKSGITGFGYLNAGLYTKSTEEGITGFGYLNAGLYTNSTEEGACPGHLMYGTKPRTDSISPHQFLSMVYEPVQQGHVHAENMAQYAEDAKTTDKPWELWQVNVRGEWRDLTCDPSFAPHLGYRRKPKTHVVHGVEIPVFEFTLKVGEKFYAANVGLPEFFEQGYRSSEGCTFTQRMFERELLYPYTEEGRQAAILHAKAMLGLVK